ncbi:MAG: hypothetical protein MHM6MM_001698 [Cercozoa sp. M6MM]
MKEGWVCNLWGFASFLILLPCVFLSLTEHLLPTQNWTKWSEMWDTERAVSWVLMSLVVIVLLLIGCPHVIAHKRWTQVTGWAQTKLCLQAFLFLHLLSLAAIILGTQKDLYSAGMSNEVFALLIGLAVANIPVMLGYDLPAWITLGGKSSETLIKVGLVLLGLDLQTLGALGANGVVVALPVTVAVFTLGYATARRFFVPKTQRKLAMLLVSGTSICGSSAATAVQTTIDATQEDLTLTVSILSIFTIAQMMTMPFLAQAIGLPDAVSAAGLGGTINSTGGVVAAASFLGGEHQAIWVDIASTVKMIQNTVIGLFCVGVLAYWLRYEDPLAEIEEPFLETDAGIDVERKQRQVPAAAAQPWYKLFWAKFPKFVLGFFALSVVLTVMREADELSAKELKKLMEQTSKWWFTLGFAGIGLATRLDVMYAKLKSAATANSESNSAERGDAESGGSDEKPAGGVVSINDEAFTARDEDSNQQEQVSVWKAVMPPFTIYLTTQLYNILITFSVAYWMFHRFDPVDFEN